MSTFIPSAVQRTDEPCAYLNVPQRVPVYALPLLLLLLLLLLLPLPLPLLLLLLLLLPSYGCTDVYCFADSTCLKKHD
jgi:hypothetical protein